MFRNMFLLALIFGSSVGNTSGMATVGVSGVFQGSIANRAQLESLDKLTEQELKSKRSNEESLRILNAELAKMQLPLVDIASPDLKISISSMSGFAASEPVGVEIRDGKHRFCLPCAAGGWNSFRFGIIKWERSPRNTSGKYFALINTIDKAQNYGKNGTVNSGNWPATRRALVVVKTPSASGVYVIYDNEMEFFSVPLPRNEVTSSPVPSTIRTHGELLLIQVRAGFPDVSKYSAEEIGKPKDETQFVAPTEILDEKVALETVLRALK